MDVRVRLQEERPLYVHTVGMHNGTKRNASTYKIAKLDRFSKIQGIRKFMIFVCEIARGKTTICPYSRYAERHKKDMHLLTTAANSTGC